MSSSIRSFFHSDRSSSNELENKEEDRFLPPDVTDRITNLDSQCKSFNISCCGGDEKKNAIKSQIKAPQLPRPTTISPIHEPPELIEPDDYKSEHVVPQYAVKIDVDRELMDQSEVMKAMKDQLNQRALTRSMNSNNDDPPRLCTKKHCSFANEPLSIKPVTCIPGIGPKHGNLCEKHGITMAHQLLSKYIISLNDEEFEKSLVDQFGFTPKSAAMTRDGLKELRRHLI